ncbi:MAG: nucleoside phosphorylase [Rikenellaceae bacterium]
MRIIPASELIVNDDGTIFHLHLLPEQVADIVMLVGDPGRVAMVSAMFDSIECQVSNREFLTVTGSYKGTRMSVLSTGIGVGNIDICLTELDALANIDLTKRVEKSEHRQLTLVRLGTTGALQADLRVGDQIFSSASVGFDGVLNYYAGRDQVCNLDIERAFTEHVGWSDQLPAPYFVESNPSLCELFAPYVKEGITISSPGFYAPQGRWVRLRPADMELNEKIESFRYNDRRITNYEMEGAPLAGLAKMLGHRAATICTVVAQRVAQDACPDYKPFVEAMVRMALDRLSTLK